MLYAIGEIVLVVIGILIALQINNWNEENQRKELKRVYYTQLLKDLDSDRTYIIEKLDTYDARRTIYTTYLESYKKPGLQPEDVLASQYKLNFTTDHIRFQNSTIESLENTGDSKLIPIEIRNKLNILKRDQELISEFTNNNYQYFMNSIQPTGLSGSIPGFASRLSNQPDLKEYLKIEANSDVIIRSIEYAMFLKNYTEQTNSTQLNAMLEDIESIIDLIANDQ